MPRRSSAALAWYPHVHSTPMKIPQAPVRLRRVVSNKKRRHQRREPGVNRVDAWSLVDERIKSRLREESDHLGVSMSWLASTIMADALRIDLDKRQRAYTAAKE